MIYTITLNPAIDFVIELKNLDYNKTNYYQNTYSQIGGKGINVAIILNNLKSDVVATGFLGDSNSSEFIQRFNQLNLKNNFFLYDGKTRTNFKVKDLNNNKELEFNGTGQELNKDNINKLLDYLKSNIKKDDLVIASGSIPVNLDTQIYKKIGEIVNKNQGLFILDTSKKPLLEGLKSKPFLIKPNINELFEIFDIKNVDCNFDQIKKLVYKLHKLGAKNILLSMQSKGSYFFSQDNSIYKINAVKGQLVNSVGAGDSMLGGFCYGIDKQLSLIDSLKYASASGSATAFSKWLASKNEIEKYYSEIKVNKLEGEIWK